MIHHLHHTFCVWLNSHDVHSEIVNKTAPAILISEANTCTCHALHIALKETLVGYRFHIPNTIYACCVFCDMECAHLNLALSFKSIVKYNNETQFGKSPNLQAQDGRHFTNNAS